MKKHTLPKLPYKYNALEPYIDEQTMRIHHTRHHQAYTDKFNAALEKHPRLFDQVPEELIANLSKIPENIREAVKNHGGGFINHSFFWECLTPKKQDISEELKKQIERDFESFDNFKEQFTNAALTLFGSGWVWLVLDNDKLEIVTTSNQDSPLTQGKIPLLTLDMWEHGFYLKWQYRKNEYVRAFWNIVNWDKVSERFIDAIK
jgi:Fe-Mn family superoxide dismutase